METLIPSMETHPHSMEAAVSSLNQTLQIAGPPPPSPPAAVSSFQTLTLTPPPLQTTAFIELAVKSATVECYHREEPLSPSSSPEEEESESFFNDLNRQCALSTTQDLDATSQQ